MIKTLLVDDERLIRELVKDSINFAELGYEIVGEAEDGIDALRKVQELSPLLIILDINIPFMNGVELSRVIKAKFPEIKIVILTGHGEFEYAREFIKIGVSDYVLKPIDPNNFSELLLQLKEKIESEVNLKTHLEKLEIEAESSSNLLRRQFLSELIEPNQFSETAIADRLVSLNLSLDSQKITLATFEIDGAADKRNTPQTRDGSIYVVWNFANKYFSDWHPFVAYVDKDGRLICITNSKLPDVADLLGVCESIRSEVAETLGFTISIGVSGPLDGYSQISRLYKDSIFCLQEKFFRGSNLLIAYHEISNKFRSMEPLYIKEKQEILIMLRSENRDGFIQLLEDTDRVIMKIRPEIEIIFAAYSEIYTEITKYILENNLTIDGVIPEYANAFQLIRSNETLAGLNHWMVHLYDLVSLNVKNKSKKRSAQLVEKAREFIEGNYWKPELTIEEVSERLFINPSYLSKIFKRDMKISMIEFLTDLRLKKAKEAMDATREMNIGQIAYKVGYTDSFYFSKVFKKTFGVSPSTYMNRKHH